MEDIVLPPTPDIEKVCDQLNILIHRILSARNTFPILGEYEAGLESLNLLNLMIRNVEAVTELATKDLVLLPSTINLTRSLFEMAMKTLWMLAPQDAFDRKVRWLAQLQTEEDYYDRFAQRLGKFGADNI
jgi:hypothetical protein